MADTTTATISRGSYSADITFNKLEHDFNKDIGILAIPKSTDPDNSAPISTGVLNPLNYLIDIGKLKQLITISGWLLEETGSSALTKKDNIESILSDSGLVTLQWLVGTTTITKKGNITKCKVVEVAGRIGDGHPSTQNKGFEVMLIFTVGQHKG